jgi:hypothetical protein
MGTSLPMLFNGDPLLRRPTSSKEGWSIDMFLCLLSIGLNIALTTAGEQVDLSQWNRTAGDWQVIREHRPMLRQGARADRAVAVNEAVSGIRGAWRCVVEPGPGDDAVGIVVLANDKGEGFECVLGGTGRMRGFMLRDRQSRVLWSDEWAPWQVYEPAIIEIVVESGRLRCQLIHWDGTELVSQSEWVKIDSDSTNKPGHLGLMTEGGIARFWGWEIADDPLMAMTPNAPNKLRLTGGADSMWVLNGGDWRWSDRKRDAVVQAATVERAWVYHKGVTGKHRPFSCQVEVERGAGGAGMVFQGRGPDKPGLLAWLGGRPGEGSLMLYTLKTDGFNAEWSSPGGLWRFDIPYILVGQTKPGHARVQLEYRSEPVDRGARPSRRSAGHDRVSHLARQCHI